MANTSSSPRIVSRWALWFGVFGGLAAWVLHLAIGFAIAYDGCLLGGDRMRTWLLLLTVVLAVVALAATLVAYGNNRRVSSHAPVASGEEVGGAVGRTRLMAVMGAWLSGLSLLIILLVGIAIIGIRPCA